MNLFSVFSILTALTSFGLAILLLKRWGEPIKRNFGIFAISIGIWGIGASVVSLIGKDNYNQALFWWQIAYTGIIFIPVFYTNFIFRFLKLKKNTLLFVIYILAGIFLFFNWYAGSKLFLGDLKFIFNQFYWHD